MPDAGTCPLCGGNMSECDTDMFGMQKFACDETGCFFWKNPVDLATLGILQRSAARAEAGMELARILNTVEETDDGREFCPTTISSCRVMDAKRITELMGVLGHDASLPSDS